MDNKKLILWDWNGTLLDDVNACVDAMNIMLEKRNMSFLDIEKYKQIFTFPVQNYYKTLGFDFEKEPFEDLSVEYIDLYKQYAINSPLQKGATEVLSSFKDKGYKKVILSASEQNALCAQVEEREIASYFDSIIGLDNIHARSKLHNALHYLHHAGIYPEQITFIGDTYHDFEVANAIGCKCILVKNGHMNLNAHLIKGVDFIDDLTLLNYE